MIRPSGFGCAIFAWSIVLIAAATTDPMLDKITKTALLEATEIYERELRNQTALGAQSTRGAKTSPFTRELTRINHVFSIAEDLMIQRYKVAEKDARVSLRQNLPAACQTPTADCRVSGGSKFRTADGTCNNLRNPIWGAKNTPLRRVARQAYEDGRDEPRGRYRSYLPNPRHISVNIHPDAPDLNRRVTNMVPQFGQFLDHDITRTPVEAGNCCQNPNNRDCWAIAIARNDPFYSRQGQTCLDFTRSTAYCRATTGAREQINSNTAFIDASHIYGSDLQTMNSLREFRGGRLRTQSQLRGFLPLNTQNTAVNGAFSAGDDRVNEMPALTVMHNLFLMEHNRIANGFASITNWNDERIFQETRRIVIAEMENIVYDEYLPLVLGNSGMTEYDLHLGNEYTKYDPTIDPSIFNSFATAAYRFGHSMVPGLVRLISNTNQEIGRYEIRNEYFRSFQMTQANGQGYDWILRGLMSTNSPESDPFVTTGVTNFLFKQPNSNFGSDLVARNIQRGRDHGLPGYNEFRRLCGLPRITSWTSRPSDIRADAWDELVTLYRNWNSNLTPDHIDLFTGGLVENPASGAIVGPTFQCLIGVQFARLKFGDRYFFTHGNERGSFTGEQVRQIRARKLGDIICENSQQPSATRNVFLIPSSSNPFIACNDRSRGRLNLRSFV